MSHIFVVGAGLAAIFVAFELRQSPGKDQPITLIRPATLFQLVPSNPWVAVDGRERGDVTERPGALPQFPPRNGTSAKKANRVHLAQVGFENDFLRNMRKGLSNVFYATLILKRFGITKLKSS